MTNKISDERLAAMLNAEIPLGMSVADARSILTELQSLRSAQADARTDGDGGTWSDGGKVYDPPAKAEEVEVVARLGGINGVKLQRHIDQMKPEQRDLFNQQPGLITLSSHQSVIAAKDAALDAATEAQNEFQRAYLDAEDRANAAVAYAEELVISHNGFNDKFAAQFVSDAVKARLSTLNGAKP